MDDTKQLLEQAARRTECALGWRVWTWNHKGGKLCLTHDSGRTHYITEAELLAALHADDLLPEMPNG